MESTLIQEIEEELQKKKMEKLWKTYGGYVLGAAVALVLGTAIYTAWKNQKVKAETKATTEIIELLQSKEVDPAKRMDSLLVFADKNKGNTQGTLSLFEAAALAVKSGDMAKAIATYDAIAASSKIDDLFRQLGTLLSVQTQLDAGNPEELLKRLAPLTKNDCAWRFSAKEYSAHLSLKAGKNDAAKKFFQEIVEDADAPADLRKRAENMLTLAALER